METIREIKKAIGGALVAGGGAIATAAAQDGISNSEWWLILGTTLAAFGVVWAVPNRQSQ